MITANPSETREAIEAIGQGLIEAESDKGHVRRVGDTRKHIIQSLDRVVTLVGEFPQATASQRVAAQDVRENRRDRAARCADAGGC